MTAQPGIARRVGVSASALAIGLALAAPATAAAPRFASTVDYLGLGPDPTYVDFIGHVHSRKRKCERRRQVTVYYRQMSGVEAVGTDRTDRRGHWRIPANVVGDDPYYATVKRRAIGRGERRIVCKPDRSPDFRLP